jgi:hypothetical protein
MPFKSRKPGSIIRKAEDRLAGMKIIDKKYKSLIDYGGPQSPLKSADIEDQIKLSIDSNDLYNESLKHADIKAGILKSAESKLADMYSRVLSGCVGRFGSDSEEISLLGGTRKSERKKSKRKKTLTKNIKILQEVRK